MSRFVLATLVAVLAGCGSLQAQHAAIGPSAWPQYQAGPAHNAAFAGSLRSNWLTPTGGKINGGLALVDGTLYAVSFDRKLYALDPANGAVRWTAGADNILMSTPIVQDGLVLVGSGKDGFLKPDDAASQVWGRPEGDDLIAFGTSGNKAWTVHTVGDDMPSPAVSGGRVFLANGDAHAYALNLRDGSAIWTVPLEGISAMASATLHDGVFFTSICHNAPYVCSTVALDQISGRRRWTNPIGGSDCTPTVDNGLVFVQHSSVDVPPYHTGGRVTVAAIDERTGRTRWQHTYAPAPFTYVASSERQITGTSADGTYYDAIANLDLVIAYDERTGKERWRVRTSGNVKMSPVVYGGKVYFGDTEGVLYTVDARNGRVIHTGSYLQAFSVSPPVIYGQTLFIADGNLVLAIPLDTLQ